MRYFDDDITLTNDDNKVKISFQKLDSRTVSSTLWVTVRKKSDDPAKPDQIVKKKVGTFDGSFEKALDTPDKLISAEIISAVVYLENSGISGLSVNFSQVIDGYPKPVRTDEDKGKKGQLFNYDLQFYFEVEN